MKGCWSIGIASLAFLGLVTTAAYGIDGTYEVPVSEAALAPVAVNPVDSISARINERQQLRVSYKLPVDVAGDPEIRNTARGTLLPDGTAHVVGDFSSGDCLLNQSTGEVTCRFVFNDSFKARLVPDQIAEQIAARYPDQPQLAQQKEQVMRTFGFDAIGILRFKFR